MVSRVFAARHAGLSSSAATEPNAADTGLIPVPSGSLGGDDVVFLKEPGDTSAISISDINQGAIGDCYFLSGLGEIAQWDPSFISGMITYGVNGTEVVRLYQPPGGGEPSFGEADLRPVYEIINNKDLPTDGVNSVTPLTNGKLTEIWPQVIEQAFAQLNGGYAAISNGYAELALEQLTGNPGSFTPAASVTTTELRQLQQAGKAISFQTPTTDTNPSYGLIADHSYIYTGLAGSGANAAVKLVNPWGYDNPTAAIPVAQLGALFADIQFAKIG